MRRESVGTEIKEGRNEKVESSRAGVEIIRTEREENSGGCERAVVINERQRPCRSNISIGT
jgi:hypothetical protein